MKHDIEEMSLTVRDEFKDTVGIARPARKVAAYKEAEKRIDKTTKSIKHQVAEIMARDEMKFSMVK